MTNNHLRSLNVAKNNLTSLTELIEMLEEQSDYRDEKI
jgi:hypothetical protein